MKFALPLLLLLAFAAPAVADDGRPEIDTLVRTYYEAMAAEDLPKVATLLHLTDEDAAKALLQRYALVFRATDLTLLSLTITNVALDDAGEGGIVYATVQTTIAQRGGQDAFEKESEVALVVARAEGRWRILRATTQGRLALERKLILYRRQLTELRETEDAPPPSTDTRAPASTGTAEQPDGVAGWVFVAGFVLLLVLLATRLRFAQRLLGALLVAPLIAGTVVALGQTALNAGATADLSLPELLLSPWTLWASGQVWLPAAAWAAAGLAGGLIMRGPLTALLAGLLIPLGPWILIQKPWFESPPVSAAGLHDTYERLAAGGALDLQALVGACLLGALLGGLLVPGRHGGSNA